MVNFNKYGTNADLLCSDDEDELENT